MKSYVDMLRDKGTSEGDAKAIARKCVQNRGKESYAACLAAIDESFPQGTLEAVADQIYAANAQYAIFREFPNLGFLRRNHGASTRWRELDEGFERIDLKILDIETMFFFKMRAVNDRLEHGVGLEGSTPRPQDVEDIELIMSWMNEDDLRNIKNAKMASCVLFSPFAVEWIEEHRGGQPVAAG